MKMACPEFVTLANGAKMPLLGFGTWQAKDEEVEKAMHAALEAGYRHIDTASLYDNEHVIGKVLRSWISQGKLRREDLFLVTKLPPVGLHAEAVEKWLVRSLEKLQTDYVDLYLIHLPVGFQEVGEEMCPVGANGEPPFDLTTDHVSVWKSLEAQVDAGRARAIGVSNFTEKQIQRILDNCRIKPANHQVEVHVQFQQKPLVDFCHRNGISTTAYSPLGSPGSAQFVEGDGSVLPNLLEDPTVKEIAEKHKKTTAQVLLRHIVQKGLAAIPKSTNPQRIAQNIQEMKAMEEDEDVQALRLKGEEIGRYCETSEEMCRILDRLVALASGRLQRRRADLPTFLEVSNVVQEAALDAVHAPAVEVVRRLSATLGGPLRRAEGALAERRRLEEAVAFMTRTGARATLRVHREDGTAWESHIVSGLDTEISMAASFLLYLLHPKGHELQLRPHYSARTPGCAPGYAPRYAAGHAARHAAGYAPGHTHDYAVGQAAGYAPSHAAGYAPGHTDDYAYAPGHTNDYAAGHTNDYAAGQAAGYTDDYTYAPGHTNDYAAGHANGYAPGHTNDHAAGYAPSHPAGSAPGHTNDYAPGLTNGYAPDRAPSPCDDLQYLLELPPLTSRVRPVAGQGLSDEEADAVRSSICNAAPFASVINKQEN